MKKAKRTLALLLALLMSIALCACGGKSEPAPAATAAPAETASPAETAAPAPTAAPEPAAAKPGVGKYGIRYLELSQAYMEGVFTEYGLKAKPGVGSRKLVPEDMEDYYIELKDDGTGYLFWGDDNQGPITEWELDGEKLAFKAGVADFDGAIKDGVMLIEIDEGYDMVFGEEGAKLPAAELITVEEYYNLLYSEEEAEPEADEPKAEEPKAEEPGGKEKDKISSDSKKKGADSSGKAKAVTVDEEVLFEGDGLRVTTTGECVDDPAHGLKIAISVRNDTDIDYLIGCEPVFVNGCAAKAYVEEKSIDEAGFTTVDAHSTLNCYICTELKDVKPLGIDKVARLDCGFKFINADDWFDEQPDVGICTVITSLADDYTEPAAPQGEELYDDEGVRIVCLDQAPEDDTSGMDNLALLYVVNDSPMSVDLVSITTYVNGEKISGLASLKLLPGTRGVMPFYVMESSLEDAGIKDVDSLECEFWVQFKKDSGDMDHLTKTDPLSIPVA